MGSCSRDSPVEMPRQLADLRKLQGETATGQRSPSSILSGARHNSKPREVESRSEPESFLSRDEKGLSLSAFRGYRAALGLVLRMTERRGYLSILDLVVQLFGADLFFEGTQASSMGCFGCPEKSHSSSIRALGSIIREGFDAEDSFPVCLGFLEKGWGAPCYDVKHITDWGSVTFDILSSGALGNSKISVEFSCREIHIKKLSDDSPVSEPRLERQYSRQRIFGLLSDSDSDSDDEGRPRSNRDSAEDENNQRRTEEAIAEEMKRIKELPKPKHHWNFVDQVVQRQLGGRARYQSSVLFSHHYYDSLHVPKRLELMYKMEFHRGCVNALSFNSSGSRLASGSDDFHIAIWDWAREKAVTTFNSHHRNNVFQSKFLPLSGDSHIVSCARDGQVRLAELSSSGEYKSTRKLAKHNGPAHKLATLPTSPHVVLSAGEDAVVLSIDIRQEQPDKLAVVKDISGSKVSLYSIHAHPVNEHQYCVSGHDQYVRVYDRRLGCYAVLKLCPRHLYEASPTPTVTCAVYSCNGDAVLASYNDDDIYLFDTSRTDAADAVHRYSGHRNNATVKGVNFFGPGSQYVVSGSDCGNIFIWHRETEAIVQCMPGDENGVVNVLEPHPHIPVLATSGLDDDVKIWVPTSEYDPELPELDQIVKSNLRRRHKERNDEFTGLDRQMLMVLWNHIRRNDRRRRRGTVAPFDLSNGADGNEGTVGGSSSDESNDSDGSDGQHGIQCATH
ncbi:DDB1- and CUL4-associated factor 8-like [Macrobrachium nipponense]|uniref:DDB1- and CUL4-associated factor 8-like n=1 Tax=Macrobrachium nipponense TaxID=159736 RepID=UPI0030C8B560